MNVDDRLHDHLLDRAATIVLPPGDPDRVIARAGQRRRRRRAALGAGASLSVIAAVVAIALVRGPGTNSIGVTASPPAVSVASPFDWTVVSLDEGLGYSSRSVASAGALYALSTAPGAPPVADGADYDSRQSLYRSTDGQGWAQVGLPASLWATGLSADGARLYAVGTSPAGGGRALTIASSADGGVQWESTDLPLDLAALEARHPGQIRLVGPLVTAGPDGNVVAAVTVVALPEVAALLGDRLPQDGGWEQTNDGVDVYAYAEVDCGRFPPSATIEQSVAPEGSDGPVGCIQAVPDPTSEAHYSWTELGLDPELQQLLAGRLHLFVSADGSGFAEVVSPGAGTPVGLVADADGYELFLAATSADRNRVTSLRSADGTTWAAEATPVNGYLLGAGMLDGRTAAVFETFEADMSRVFLRHRQADGSWASTDLPGPSVGPGSYSDVAFGPLGLAVLGMTYDDAEDRTELFLVHSRDGRTYSTVPLNDFLGDEALSKAGVEVTADAIVVRMTPPASDPGLPLPAQTVLVGTPR
ncbi:MAG: hypothetical protein ACT4PW_09940 [Acidimicrobiia bacterium]